jgi:hypothetical protein
MEALRLAVEMDGIDQPGLSPVDQLERQSVGFVRTSLSLNIPIFEARRNGTALRLL